MTQPLPIVGYINPLVADALRDPTSGINVTQLRAVRNETVFGAVVMKADVDTEIAKRDAEIARLRKHLEAAHLSSILGDVDPAADLDCCRQIIEKALKGPEA
ncbi:hypothetical protein ACJRO0_13345 [Acetobacter oryzifermentans]|uniref:hypothetical protein n=1 Tax=Acetobacter oryzifermentans TaxID=1633874 RepID=UPI0039BF8FF3